MKIPSGVHQCPFCGHGVWLSVFDYQEELEADPKDRYPGWQQFKDCPLIGSCPTCSAQDVEIWEKWKQGEFDAPRESFEMWYRIKQAEEYDVLPKMMGVRYIDCPKCEVYEAFGIKSISDQDTYICIYCRYTETREEKEKREKQRWH